jgi:lysophospholipase L1-like esterase
MKHARLCAPWRRLLAGAGLLALLPWATQAAPHTVYQAQASTCAVVYTVSQWADGFTADVKVTNTGVALSSWNLAWSFPGSQQITSAWSTMLAQNGASVTARNLEWNGSLPTGGSQSFGFQASYSTSNPTPTNFALNGVACTTDGTLPTALPSTPTATAVAPSPTATAPAGTPGVFQAEAAVLGGGALVENTNTGYHGSGYVNFPATGGWLEFQQVSSSGGATTLRLRYALGATTSRTGLLTVNGASQPITFEPTGAWTTWLSKEIAIPLNSGAANTIRLESNGQDLGNVDQAEVGSATSPTVTPIGPTTTPAPAPTLRPTVTPTPVADGPNPDPALRARCTGTSPISCHYDLAPGNYNVTVVLGSASAAGVTAVEAEARRALLGPVTTAAGTFSRQTFTVNVREPEGQPTGQGGTGTPGLDLRFTGSAPRLDGIGIAPSSALRVFLAGDSTVCDQPAAPYTGWGQMLPQSFKLGLSVANYADSGESSGSFLSNSKLFPTLRPLIRSGDYVLIQFGHNDKQVTAAQFKQNLSSLVAGVRQQGGLPVLVTPPVRRLFGSDGRLTSTALHINGVGADLPAVMRQLASEQNVPLIDLTAKSRALVEALGASASQQLFLTQANDGVADNTHFSRYGANEMSKLVIQGIRERNLALASYLR